MKLAHWRLLYWAVTLALGIGLVAATIFDLNPKPSPTPAPARIALAGVAERNAGHPCVPGDYFMACAAPAPGRLLLSPSPLLAPFAAGARFGVDFAWGGPSGAYAIAHGARFGASYLSWSSKDWTAALLRSYRVAGAGVVFVRETSAARVLDGYSAGLVDARSAAQEEASLGARGAITYFAADFDTTGYGCRALCPYYDGVNAAIGKARDGAYGGLNTIRVLFDNGRISHGWQTLAWSYGNWDLRACLRQTSINDGWFGYGVDFDYAVCANYGQWPTYRPPPPPKPRCFGRHAHKNLPRCKAERRQVAKWSRAAASSELAFTVRGCQGIERRQAYFAHQLKVHPHSVRAPHWRAALRASRRARRRQSCDVFAGRVAHFRALIHHVLITD